MSGTKTRNYTLHASPIREKVTFEVIGGGLKRVSGALPASGQGRASNLSKGRQKGSRCKGWTVSTRRTCREILEENKGHFQSFAHLRFRPGAMHDSVLLREVSKKLSRWFRKHVEGSYFWVLEFMPRSNDPHFHVGITAKSDTVFREKLEKYWFKISEGGELTLNQRSDDMQEAIAKYLAKSATKENPDWFAAKPFRPYANNLPKKKRERIEVDASIAQAAGVTKYRFTHDGKEMLEKAMAAVGSDKVSPLADIHGEPDNEDNQEEGRNADNGDILPPAYIYPSEEELMKKACKHCWCKRMQYVPRQGRDCPMCGELWEPSIDREPNPDIAICST